MRLGLGLSLRDANKPLISAPRTPLVILASTVPKLWVDARLGTGANAWNDQSGNGNHFAEPTNPPSLTVVGGNPCYLFDGIIQRFRNAAFTVTANQWYYIIARQVSYSATGSLCGGKTSAYAAVFSTGSSPEQSIYSGVVGAPNSSAAVGAWVRIKFLCTNTGSDYLQIGANKQVGTGGANAEVGWDIGCRAGVAFGNWAIASIIATPAEPTAPEQAALDAEYCAGNFAGVAV